VSTLREEELDTSLHFLRKYCATIDRYNATLQISYPQTM